MPVKEINSFLQRVHQQYPKLKTQVFSDIQLLIGACFAGYTVTHMHPKFLKNFEKPLWQFVIFWMLFNTGIGDDHFTIIFSGIYAAGMTILVNYIINWTNAYYDSKEAPDTNQPVPDNNPDDNTNIPLNRDQGQFNIGNLE
tara:strand:- start:247 stop:669 length:423 start_codon:yes stop_codon:yes gene_type:complete